MTHPIDRAAEVITRAQFGLTTPMMSRNIADDLHAAGLLVTPAHDAAVGAKALSACQDRVQERARHMGRAGASEEYLQALNDAWGLIANLRREVEREGGGDV